MEITPQENINEAEELGKRRRPHSMNGVLALSPLIFFLALYLGSSLLADDFYKTPIIVAFLLSSAYAVAITGKITVNERISVFSKGVSDPNIMMMIWIFILAGAFASTAKAMGAIDATVALTMNLLPGKMLYAGLFIASCFISMSIGTSVGTIVALMPVATGIAEETGISNAFMAGIIVGGAFFGDNLSFISDTTIAATRTQGCSMADKFRTNFRIVLPAAVIVTAIYIFKGADLNMATTAMAIDPIKLIPYIAVLALALLGINVITVLFFGIMTNAVIGFSTGSFGWDGWLSETGSGIIGMGELIIVTVLAGGMLEMIRFNGGLDFVINRMSGHIKGRKGAESCIAALVSIANLCTANNTIAIITTGGISKEIASRFGIDPRKSASILDTFSCLVQGIIPYGAQMLMASQLSAATPSDIIRNLYYPIIMGVFAILSIIFGYPRFNINKHS